MLGGFAVRPNTDSLAQRCLLEKQKEYDKDPDTGSNFGPEKILKCEIQIMTFLIEIHRRI